MAKRREGEPRRKPMSIYEVASRLVAARRGRNGFSPTTSSPTSSSPTSLRWATPTSSFCRSASIRSTNRGATSRSACSRRPAASASRRDSPASSIARTPRGSASSSTGSRRISRPMQHGLGALRRHRALRTRRSAQGLPSGLEHRDLQFRPPRGREFPLLQRALLGRPLPHRRAARRRGRLDALPRLFPPRGRMAAEPRRQQGKPRSDRLPAPRQRARLRRLSRRNHDRRGIDRFSRRLAPDRPGRSRLRLQVEHGLDARHARLHVAAIRSIAAGATTG